MCFKDILRRPRPAQPSPETPRTVTYRVRPLDDGRFEVSLGNIIATKTYGGWHIDDTNNPGGEGYDIRANDIFATRLNSIVESSNFR